MSGACGLGHLGGCHGLAGVLALPVMSTAGAAGTMLATSTANSLLTWRGFFALAYVVLQVGLRTQPARAVSSRRLTARFAVARIPGWTRGRSSRQLPAVRCRSR